MSNICSSSNSNSSSSNGVDSKEPSMVARYTTASIFMAFLSLWTYYAYYPNPSIVTINTTMHGPLIPLALTTFYLTSLPILKYITTHYLSTKYEMKSLLIESMILYNISQVVLNGWMVYTILMALLYNKHPIIGSRSVIGPSITSGASYAVYVHYCDKYLEFVDTYFMILRGKMDQVS
jgi:elongation of very long chain fatty acids protein 4